MLAPDGLLSVCRQYPGQAFMSELVTADEVAALVDRHIGASQWMSLAVVDATSGRGKAVDVRRLLALPNDFDVKPGGFDSKDTARAAIDALAGLLDARPVAVVDTGNGLQAWWALDGDDPAWRCDSADDPRWLEIIVAVRRWGRLVRGVCSRFGAGMDSVFDAARVQRIPGSVNMKDPSNPLSVTATFDAWSPITMDRLLEACNEYGDTELSADREVPATVVAASGGWSWAARTCPYAGAALAGLDTDKPGTSGRHPWLVGKATRLAALHRYGCLTETDHADAVQRLARRFRSIIADPAFGTKRDEGPGEIDDAVDFGVRKVEGWTDKELDEEFTNKEGERHVHSEAWAAWLDDYADRPSDALSALVHQLRGWLDLPDPSHILATLAVGATADLDGEPLWLLNVAPPSSGKTEAVRLLDAVTDARLDDVTAAGLLSWSPGKDPKPQGVLTRIGERGLVTFGDLSSLLATSDRGGRDQVFGMLRRVYDGHASRDVAAAGGRTTGSLSWTGRATVVGAVTGAIDNYAAHSDKLGPRWLYCRLAERDTDAKRRAARKARQGDTENNRAAAREIAAAVVLAARGRIRETDVPTVVEDAIEDAALVTCWGRASVPRSGYGRKDPEGPPEIEDPPRIIRQALALARGLLALGLDTGHAMTLARRCVLDSMPATRRAVLTVLADAQGEALPTAEIARRAGVHRHVARIALEDLEAVGPVEGRRVGLEDDDDEDREDRRARTWTLAPSDDGQLVFDVLDSHNVGMSRWHEMLVTTLSTPPDSTVIGQDTDTTTHVSCHPSTGQEAAA